MTTTSTTWTKDFSAAWEAVRHAERILIVTHIYPDGDAIGSLLGLGNALRAAGYTVDCAVDEGVPEHLAFLPGSDSVLPKLASGTWDLMISVDASDEERTGDVGAYGRSHAQTIINLDHHATNTGFGDLHLVNPGAVSATEVIYDWLLAGGIRLNAPTVTQPLLTGLVTDTLGFRTSSVGPRTLDIARTLMESGVSLTEITARTLDSMAYATLSLWKQVFPAIKLSNGVIHTSITQDHLKAIGSQDTGGGGLSGFLATINEAMVAAVFRETDDGKVEMSFRAKRGFDVASVALSLGGGGHTQAAGATVEGTLEEVRARVLPLLKEAVMQGRLVIA